MDGATFEEKVTKYFSIHDKVEQTIAAGEVSDEWHSNADSKLKALLAQIRNEDLAALIKDISDLAAESGGKSPEVRSRLEELKARIPSMSGDAYRDYLRRRFGIAPPPDLYAQDKMPKGASTPEPSSAAVISSKSKIFAVSALIISLTSGFLTGSPSPAGILSSLIGFLVELVAVAISVHVVAKMLHFKRATRPNAIRFSLETVGAMAIISALLSLAAYYTLKTSLGGVDSLQSFFSMLMSAAGIIIALLLAALVAIVAVIYTRLRAVYAEGIGKTLLSFVLLLIVGAIIYLILFMVVGVVLSPVYSMLGSKSTATGLTPPAGGQTPALQTAGVGYDDSGIEIPEGQSAQDQNERYYWSVKRNGINTVTEFNDLGSTTVEDCRKIPKNVKYICYTQVAGRTKDLSICNLIPPSVESFGRSSCIASVAKSTGDSTLCDGLTENGYSVKALCYKDVAEETKNPSLCEKIDDKFWKERCKAKFTN